MLLAETLRNRSRASPYFGSSPAVSIRIRLVRNVKKGTDMDEVLEKKANRNDYVAPQRASHETTTWNIDPAHSAAEFNVRHMMISNVKGDFTRIIGRLDLDETDIINSRVEASIDATTIRTRESQRDAHLKSADFLDVEKFPTLSFKSIHVSKRGDRELAVAGDLTVHGVTRKVVFDVKGPSPPMKDPSGNTDSDYRPPRTSIVRILGLPGTRL
jgi:polyisoprenoid-binding protein YceI